jgi:hypothetical protein
MCLKNQKVLLSSSEIDAEQGKHQRIEVLQSFLGIHGNKQGCLAPLRKAKSPKLSSERMLGSCEFPVAKRHERVRPSVIQANAREEAKARRHARKT